MSRYASSAVRTLRLRHPLAGVRRARAYQDQEPFSTPHALNVVPRDPLVSRDRMGQRPGLKRLYTQQLGGGAPLRLLSSVSRVMTNPPTQWAHTFTGTPDPAVWDVASSWPSGAIPSLVYDAAKSGVNGSGLRTPLDIDTSKIYRIEIDFTRVPPTPFDLDLFIYARCANTSPAIGDSLAARVYLTNVTFTVELYENGSLLYSTGAQPGTITSGTVALIVNSYGDNTKKANVLLNGGTYIDNQAISGDNSVSEQRVGVRATWTTAGHPDNGGAIQAVRVTYTPLTAASNASFPVLIASANGTLYAGNPIGLYLSSDLTGIVQPTSPLTLSSARRLMAADMLQKSYIADHDLSRFISSSNCAISTGGAVTGGPDWTTRGISVKDDVAIVLSTTGGAVAGVYKLTSVSSSTLQLEDYTSGSSGTARIRVERGLKVYDPSVFVNPLSLYMTTNPATKGLVPHGCTIIARYCNSILLGGDPQAPHVWYMSRRDDPLDFNYAASSDDKGRAIAGTVSGQSTIGGPITALIPFWADYAVFATANTLGMMRGDPRINGQLDTITERSGVIDRFAWCLTPEGHLLYLGFDGLNFLGSGPSSTVEPISEQSLPVELANLDPSTLDISMEYHAGERAVLLTLAPKNGSAGAAWWIDPNIGKGPAAFYEVSCPAACQPRLQHVFNSETAALRGVALGCGDGYVRRLDSTQYFDDVPAMAMADKKITSAVQYGPFGPAGRDNSAAALLHSIEAQLAHGSGPLYWKVFAHRDAEGCIREARTGAPFAQGTFAAAAASVRTIRQLIQARGGAFIIEIGGNDATGATTWALEGLDARISAGGVQLVL